LTIHACKKEQLDQYYIDPKNEKKTIMRNYLMTLTEFNQFSNKNKPLTVREMFVKCLIKIQGVSQEKALAITDMYPTPALYY
jgi:crossover junction endonuclease MUS81